MNIHLGFLIIFFLSGAIPLTGSYFGRGNSPILTSYVSCTGNETSLEQCSKQALSLLSSSYHSLQVVGVICQGNTTSRHECSSGDLRLFGGERESEGRVEICAEGFWGTVCDNEFGREVAVVVCRQIGLGARGRNIVCMFRHSQGVQWVHLNPAFAGPREPLSTAGMAGAVPLFTLYENIN